MSSLPRPAPKAHGRTAQDIPRGGGRQGREEHLFPADGWLLKCEVRLKYPANQNLRCLRLDTVAGTERRTACQPYL